MIFWLSYLHNVHSYTGKMKSLYWIRAFTPAESKSESACNSPCNDLLHNQKQAITWINRSQLAIIRNILSNLSYKLHLCQQQNCWSLRCSWNIACWLLQLYHSWLNSWLQWIGQRQLQEEMGRETFKFWDLVSYIRCLTVSYFSAEICNFIHEIAATNHAVKTFTDTEESSGWLSWSSLETM